MALLPISISIGVLCGLWFHVTVLVPWLVAWVGYAAWASFYYAGGDAEALPKSIAANFAGMIQGALFFFLWTKIGGGSMIVLSIMIGIFCFVLSSGFLLSRYFFSAGEYNLPPFGYTLNPLVWKIQHLFYSCSFSWTFHPL